MVRYSSPMRVQSDVRATREVLKNRGDALTMRWFHYCSRIFSSMLKALQIRFIE